MCAASSSGLSIRGIVVRNRIVLLAVITVAVALAGCNTMQGLGKDLQTVGKKIGPNADEKN